jgi:hypothetical protein
MRTEWEVPTWAAVERVLQSVGARRVDQSFEHQAWELAFPAGTAPDFCGKEDLMSACQNARDELTESLIGLAAQSACHRQPLVFATLGCTGIGKSRLCDEIGDSMFPTDEPGRRAVVLKVTYNITGPSTLDSDRPGEAFRWRILAAASSVVTKVLPGLAHVPFFLDAVKCKRWTITDTFMTECLSNLLPTDVPWILVLDELVKHPLNAAAFGSILTVCSQFVRQSTLCGEPYGYPVGEELADGVRNMGLSEQAPFVDRWRCALVTSLDFNTLSPLSLSGRRPFFLPQYLLDGEKSLSLVKQLITPPFSLDHMACARLAGGHPRSLVVAAELYEEDRRVPTALAVAREAQLPDVGIEVIIDVIKKSYTPTQVSTLESDKLLNQLFQKGALLFTPLSEEAAEGESSGWIALPLVIIARAVSRGRASGQPCESFKRMLRHSEVSPEKQLEVIGVYSDLARAAMGLGVVPPMMDVFQQQQEEAREWHNLLFAFDPAKPVCFDSVLHAPRGADVPWTVLIDDIKLCDSVYYPDAVGHPAFECMYPAKFSDGTKVLVLRQDKINAAVPAAITGLNTAAAVLTAAGWDGLFLFIVTAMEAGNPTSLSKANAPVVLVTANNTRAYFSPSFSTLAHIEYLVHSQHSKANTGAVRQ